MTEAKIILRKLLEIYHRRSSFVYGKTTNRRVLLKFNKQEFPDYDYHDAEVKNRYNEAVKYLKQQNLISVTWQPECEGILVKEVWLNEVNGSVSNKAYEIAQMEPLSDKIELILHLIKETNCRCKEKWINAFLTDSYKTLSARKKLTDFWKNEMSIIEEVLHAFTLLPNPENGITERVFSLNCFNDSKYFERYIEKYIVSIAKKYEPTVKELQEAGEEIGDREILAQIGILKRNEIYEFCGDIQFVLKTGVCDFSGFTNGAAISSTCIENITSLRFENVQKICFIENKTNYEEYIKNYKQEEELVIYHGGFYSPQRAKFFSLIEKYRKEYQSCLFWADIDLGGFLMFDRLKKIFPALRPDKMFVADYCRYKENGLNRTESYLKRLSAYKEFGSDIFFEVIDLILSYKKTIEQEVMLNSF